MWVSAFTPRSTRASQERGVDVRDGELLIPGSRLARVVASSSPSLQRQTVEDSEGLKANLETSEACSEGVSLDKNCER